MAKEATAIRPIRRRTLDKKNRGLLFILPYFIIFLCFTLYPIIYTFNLSFHSWDGLGEPVFTGLANYNRLMQDTVFFKSIFNTVFIALLAMAPQMILGLILAFLLNQHRFRGGNLFKTIFYFPNLVTAVSLGVLFSLLFNYKAGSVNQFLMALNLIKEPINWKMNPLLSSLSWHLFCSGSILATIPSSLRQGLRGFLMRSWRRQK